MPRKPLDTTRAGPAIPPDDDTPDTGAAAQQRVVRTTAGKAPLPAAPGTPRSAFEAVPKWTPIAGPVIHRGRPVPEPRTGKASLYLKVYEDLAVGDCAEWPDRQANAMASILKKHGLPHLVRRLSDGSKGVWRCAPGTQAVKSATTTRKAA